MPDFQNRQGIDFIPKSAPQQASVGQQLFNLVITRGKTIIIITEAIVLLVFLSRFKLDRQIQDITESLENKQAIIQSTQNIEKEYRKIQQKIGVTSQLIDSQTNWYKKIDSFDAKVPTNIVFEKISYSANTIELSAKVQSAVTFGILIKNLLADDMIRSVILESSTYNTTTQAFSFSLSIKTT